MKGKVHIRGINVNTSSIEDKMEDLQILLEEIRRMGYEKVSPEKVYIEKIPDKYVDLINESLRAITALERKKEEVKSPTLWDKIKTIMNKKIF